MGEINYTVYIIYFLVFSFLGWVIDSAYCSIVEKRLVNSGYFKELPLCPMYGVGGITLLLSIHYFNNFPKPFLLFMGTVLLSLVEYLGGIFCVVVLRERLWDYSNRVLNLQGHVDFLHSFFWFGLTGIFVFVLYPDFIRFNSFLNRMINTSKAVDYVILILFITGAIIMTAKRRSKRLRKIFEEIRGGQIFNMK